MPPVSGGDVPPVNGQHTPTNPPAKRKRPASTIDGKVLYTQLTSALSEFKGRALGTGTIFQYDNIFAQTLGRNNYKIYSFEWHRNPGFIRIYAQGNSPDRPHLFTLYADGSRSYTLEAISGSLTPQEQKTVDELTKKLHRIHGRFSTEVTTFQKTAGATAAEFRHLAPLEFPKYEAAYALWIQAEIRLAEAGKSPPANLQIERNTYHEAYLEQRIALASNPKILSSDLVRYDRAQRSYWEGRHRWEARVRKQIKAVNSTVEPAPLELANLPSTDPRFGPNHERIIQAQSPWNLLRVLFRFRGYSRSFNDPRFGYDRLKLPAKMKVIVALEGAKWTLGNTGAFLSDWGTSSFLERSITLSLYPDGSTSLNRYDKNNLAYFAVYDGHKVRTSPQALRQMRKTGTLPSDPQARIAAASNLVLASVNSTLLTTRLLPLPTLDFDGLFRDLPKDTPLTRELAVTRIREQLSPDIVVAQSERAPPLNLPKVLKDPIGGLRDTIGMPLLSTDLQLLNTQKPGRITVTEVESSSATGPTRQTLELSALMGETRTLRVYHPDGTVNVHEGTARLAYEASHNPVGLAGISGPKMTAAKYASHLATKTFFHTRVQFGQAAIAGYLVQGPQSLYHAFADTEGHYPTPRFFANPFSYLFSGGRALQLLTYAETNLLTDGALNYYLYGTKFFNPNYLARPMGPGLVHHLAKRGIPLFVLALTDELRQDDNGQRMERVAYNFTKIAAASLGSSLLYRTLTSIGPTQSFLSRRKIIAKAALPGRTNFALTFRGSVLFTFLELTALGIWEEHERLVALEEAEASLRSHLAFAIAKRNDLLYRLKRGENPPVNWLFEADIDLQMAWKTYAGFLSALERKPKVGQPINPVLSLESPLEAAAGIKNNPQKYFSPLAPEQVLAIYSHMARPEILENGFTAMRKELDLLRGITPSTQGVREYYREFAKHYAEQPPTTQQTQPAPSVDDFNQREKKFLEYMQRRIAEQPRYQYWSQKNKAVDLAAQFAYAEVSIEEAEAFFNKLNLCNQRLMEQGSPLLGTPSIDEMAHPHFRDFLARESKIEEEYQQIYSPYDFNQDRLALDPETLDTQIKHYLERMNQETLIALSR
ncbi:MAG: hypothetical protein HYU97_04375 [Deltaproteobacteria bacterium]|nr:hypothetical protein [Deltaproteobacteria bacterium]